MSGEGWNHNKQFVGNHHSIQARIKECCKSGAGEKGGDNAPWKELESLAEGGAEPMDGTTGISHSSAVAAAAPQVQVPTAAALLPRKFPLPNCGSWKAREVQEQSSKAEFKQTIQQLPLFSW